MKLKILLLSGYDAVSHQQWRQRLANNLIEFEWVQLALSPRHFSWRTRGSSLEFAFSHAAQLEQAFDLVIATSMVDLASLRGFMPHLAAIPTIVYFHENQFVYPVSNAQPNIVNAQLTSIYSALCADRVVFNSRYNLDSFFTGATDLFARLPEKKPPQIIENLAQKSEVLAVPIENPGDNFGRVNEIEKDGLSANGKPLHIVWNHRWEYDKQPEVFFNAMRKVKRKGIPFKLHILGQSFRRVPECFDEAKREFADEIESWGFQSEQCYRQILQRADIVVSTALHDFQGLSMLEAIRAGCIPVAPHRVAYPEYIPDTLLFQSGCSADDEAGGLCEMLSGLYQNGLPARVNVSAYYLNQLLPKYRTLLLDVRKLAG